MVTVRIGGALVSVKARKEFRAEIDDAVSVQVPTDNCYLFVAETGASLGA